MKLKYLAIACLLGMGGASFTSCTDEFAEINSSEKDINNPDLRYLFTQCLFEFEPMDYSAWFYDIPRMSTWAQCTGSTGGNQSNFNLITEQGSIGYAVNDVLRYANDLRYHISQLSDDEKAKYEYMGYLCYPLEVFLGMNDSDMYGSRQYSEAEQGRYTDPPIFKPKYDTQEELVNIWLDELDQTINYLTSHPDLEDLLTTQDFIYNGDLSKWAKFANSLKLKIAARLINKDRQRALQIVNEVTASSAGVLESSADDFVYNRGRYNNHWNNDFPDAIASETLMNFMKANKDTRLLSAFEKNEFNGPVMQAFLDQGKEIPPYIAEQANFSTDGKTFLGWKTEKEGGIGGEPWVRYYGAPIEIDAGNNTEYQWIFDPTGLLLQLQTSAGGTRNYNPVSYRNQELVKGIYDFTYPDAPDATPQTDTRTTAWYGIYFSSAEVNLLLAEFNLLGASTPKSAQQHLTDGCRQSAEMFDRAAELNQVPYYTEVCNNDPLDATIQVTSDMIDEMLDHDAFKLTGDKKADLEKVYIQQYIHYILNPIDQFVNVRRSGVPMKGSSILPWQEFSEVIDYTTLLPRRCRTMEPSPTDQLRDITIAAYEAQGFTYGTNSNDPATLNTERVWYDQENPQFGAGPNM